MGGQVADKREHYRRIGVREYWVYNPERLESDQGLALFQGFRLQGATYASIKVQAEQGWPSVVLGTRWVLGDEQRTSKNEALAKKDEALTEPRTRRKPKPRRSGTPASKPKRVGRCRMTTNGMPRVHSQAPSSADVPPCACARNREPASVAMGIP